MGTTIEELIQEYFVNPLAYPDEYPPYNPVNTIVFAAIALAAAYLIFKGIKRLGIEVDERFAKAIVPFALFGATARVLVDAQALPRAVEIAGQTLYPFVTPLVYVNSFVVLALAFAVARATAGGDGGKTLSALEKIGWLLFGLSLLPLAPLFKNVAFAAEIAFLAALGVAAYVLLARRGVVERSSFTSLAVAGQCLDGAATFVGVSFAGYFEQHVLANAIFSVGSPLLFYLVKIGFALLIAYAAGRERESEEKNYVLLLVFVLGAGPGLRDGLRILAGV